MASFVDPRLTRNKLTARSNPAMSDYSNEDRGIRCIKRMMLLGIRKDILEE
jgi:hypothetical protein